MKKHIILLACFAEMALSAYARQADSTYHCTPCGNTACDTIVYYHAGTCPVCHMPLVKDVRDGQWRTSTANGNFSGKWEGHAATSDQELAFSLSISTSPLTKVQFTAADLNAMDVTGTDIAFKADSIHFELAGDDGTMGFDGILTMSKISGRFTTDDRAVALQNRSGLFELKKLKAKPVPYTVKEVVFYNRDVKLAGSLYLPNGTGRFPALICNHSSGDKPRYDGAFMADYMARRGIAVLIYDKRGDGASTGDWHNSTFEQLADDCIAGFNLLRSEPKINSKLIGIFGHSQGATISPIIVDRCPAIAFNIAAAGFAVAPEEQDIFRVTNILRHQAHFSDSVIDSAISFYRIWLEVARTGKGWEAMQSANEKVKNSSWYSWVEPPAAGAWPWKWYKSAGNYDFVPYWEKVKIPTLLIYGDKDEITPIKPSITNITTALKKACNRQYTVIIKHNAIHYFAQVKTEGDLWTKSTPGYFEDIYAWIAAQCREIKAHVHEKGLQ
jgi:hypothetical protein